jgi:hypothetical protein
MTKLAELRKPSDPVPTPEPPPAPVGEPPNDDSNMPDAPVREPDPVKPESV